MVCSRKVRRRICCALSAAVLCAAVFFAASWFATGWSDDGAGEYPGGRIVVDSAGEVLRVSLGRGDADCRPYYEASPGDWIAKALVASEDSTFWTHCGVRPASIAGYKAGDDFDVVVNRLAAIGCALEDALLKI